jgi:hypothetical protein
LLIKTIGEADFPQAKQKMIGFAGYFFFNLVTILAFLSWLVVIL